MLAPYIGGGVIKNTGLGVIKNADLSPNTETSMQGNTMPEMEVLADVCIKGETHPLFRHPGAVPVAASAPERNGEECVPSPSTPEPLPLADGCPPPAPVASIWFTGTLIERVADALLLAANTPKRQQAPLVQAVLAAQNITLSDKRLKLVLADARYLLRLRDLADEAVKREYGKSRAMLLKEQKRVGLANLKAMQLQHTEREGEGLIWALYYRYQVAHNAYCERFPTPPELDDLPTTTRAARADVETLGKHQRGLIDPEQAVQRAIWQREGMDQREIDARETLEALDIGTITPIQNSQSTPYDALGLPERLRNLIRQAVPGHITATQRMDTACIVALPYH